MAIGVQAWEAGAGAGSYCRERVARMHEVAENGPIGSAGEGAGDQQGVDEVQERGVCPDYEGTEGALVEQRAGQAAAGQFPGYLGGGGGVHCNCVKDSPGQRAPWLKEQLRGMRGVAGPNFSYYVTLVLSKPNSGSKIASPHRHC